jgi:diguanylate cyclase (GGDEF)-like protein/PAS domain S-box-containing protein
VTETNEAEALLDFLYACPVGLVEIDREGRIGTMNPFAMKLLLPLAGMRGCDNLFVMLESTAPELRNMYAEFDRPRGTVCDGHRITVDLGPGRKGTDPQVLGCTLVKVSDNRAIATIADVSAQVAQERKLKQAETWFASLINGVNDYAVLSLTREGVIEASNPAFERQTGHPSSEVSGKRLDRFLCGSRATGTLSLSEQMRIAARDGWSLDESWQTRRNGERYLCQRLVASRPADAGARAGYMIVLRDVTHQSGDAAQMLHLLTHDQLTGASNRASFLQTIERETQRWHDQHQPLSLLMLDIDHFKQINDRWGHPMGDEVLRRVTGACLNALGPRDLFARLGGEEFAVLLPGVSKPDAIVTAERLRIAIRTLCVEVPGDVLSITASFGCATIEDAGGAVDTLIRAADEQLYRAKRAGRDRVCAVEQVSHAA